MNFASIAVVAVIAALLVLAVRYIARRGLGSLCGEEAGCGASGGCAGCYDPSACRPK